MKPTVSSESLRNLAEAVRANPLVEDLVAEASTEARAQILESLRAEVAALEADPTRPVHVVRIGRFAIRVATSAEEADAEGRAILAELRVRSSLAQALAATAIYLTPKDDAITVDPNLSAVQEDVVRTLGRDGVAVLDDRRASTIALLLRAGVVDKVADHGYKLTVFGRAIAEQIRARAAVLESTNKGKDPTHEP